MLISANRNYGLIRKIVSNIPHNDIRALESLPRHLKQRLGKCFLDMICPFVRAYVLL